MGRVKFSKGKQRDFLDKVLFESNCPSLRSLNQFGFDVPYSTWKNYYVEARCLPQNLFYDLCKLIKVNPKEFIFEILPDNFGQILGGKSIRNK